MRVRKFPFESGQLRDGEARNEIIGYFSRLFLDITSRFSQSSFNSVRYILRNIYILLLALDSRSRISPLYEKRERLKRL